MASMSFAGVSVVGEVRPPQPAAATTAVTYSGYHLLVVNGYSSLVKDIPNGDCIESRHFRVGDYRWTLQCYPNGYGAEQDGFMSFYLFLDQGNVVDPVMVQYEFSFVVDQVLQNQNYCPALLDGAKQTLRFFSRYPYSFSLPYLTKREIFEKSKYLKNDSFTIRCDIVITKDVNINEAGGTVPVSNVLPPPPDIRQDLGDLLQSGAGADVTFQVGGGTFRAHRCVLAARSAVFKAQLFGPMKEGTTTGVVHVRDMEEKVFKLLLGFIYSDSVPEVDDIEKDEIMWQHLI
jgi:speckle-type POZ protein